MTSTTRQRLRRRGAYAALAAAVLTSGLLTGCGTQDDDAAGAAVAAPAAKCDADVVVAEGEDTRTVATAFGEVVIPADPQRIVALEGGAGPALESGLEPVGIADDYAESYLPGEYDQVKDLPLVLTPDGWDFDKLASLEPDLMIGFVRGGTEEELSQDKVREWERLSKLAPTVLIRSNGSGQTKDVSCALQVALGHADEADAAKQAYEEKAAEIREQYADVLDEHVVVGLDAYEDEVSVFSPISWIGDVLADAGATPHPLVADETEENAVFLSTEELRQVDDATLVLHSETVDGKPDLGAVDLQKAPTYAELAAVKADRSHGVPYFFADRYATGLKTLEAFEEILQDLQG